MRRDRWVWAAVLFRDLSPSVNRPRMTESALPNRDEAEQPAEHEHGGGCGEEPMREQESGAKSAPGAADEIEQACPASSLVASSSAPVLASADEPAPAPLAVRQPAASAAASAQPAQAGEMDIRCFVEAVVEGRASLAHTVNPSEIPKSSHKIGLSSAPTTSLPARITANNTVIAWCVHRYGSIRHSVRVCKHLASTHTV